ncbi:hypothetical protein [Tomitella gaofuii]|uniref:hypothetical protein n=1 Tax=Tomitella gaofuii TaxID=2760083 RepID=UPI0015F81A81|nr:hypothetical protein [Tomitella gaofuii]
MGFGRVKKLGIGVVAAATMAGGAALAAPAVAMADAPTIAVEQDGNDVTVTTTDENTSGINACFPALVSGETALKLLVAYQAGDYGAIADLLVNGGNDVKLGKIASNNKLGALGVEYYPFPSPSTTEWTVDDGVYILVGGCAAVSLSTLGDLVTDGPTAVLGDLMQNATVRPLIVPNGIGSIAPALDFGSLLLKSGDALSALSSDGLLTGLLGAGTGS